MSYCLFPGDIPVIETSRLRLRGHRPNDLLECTAMWSDPEVTRYVGGRPFSAEEVWARILRYTGHWVWLGYGFWLIEERATGRFVGEVGFADFQRDIQPSLDGIPEAGWVLSSRAHGQGYATEAVLAAIRWSETRFRAARTACLINPENRASVRVAEKCGFREWTTSQYKGQPILLFQR